VSQTSAKASFSLKKNEQQQRKQLDNSEPSSTVVHKTHIHNWSGIL